MGGVDEARNRESGVGGGGRLSPGHPRQLCPAKRRARRGNSEITMCSWTACAPSPTPPSPSRVGMPSPAVKLPSEPPPTAASASFQPRSCAIPVASSYKAAIPTVRSIGGRLTPPLTSTLHLLLNGRSPRIFLSIPV